MRKLLLLTAITFLFASCNKEKEYDEKLKETFKPSVFALMYCSVICDGVQEAWRTAIFDKKTPSGKYCNDFDDAIDEMMTYYKENGTLDSLDYYKSKLAVAASELADPPSSRKECYNDMLKYVSDIIEFCDIARSPRGSYSSYKEEVEELFDKIKKDSGQLTIKHGKILRVEEKE